MFHRISTKFCLYSLNPTFEGEKKEIRYISIIRLFISLDFLSG